MNERGMCLEKRKRKRDYGGLVTHAKMHMYKTQWGGEQAKGIRQS
jgi:hypothetical protein